MKKIVMALGFVMMSAIGVGAVNTTVTYSSGVLVAIFLGFCAMIVLMQLLPAIAMLYAGLKAIFSKDPHKIKTKS